jgi:hypothetical protein
MKKLLLILCIACAAGAADHCVREGASGTGSGADWTNAYTALPATLTRGDVYYVADGSYGALTIAQDTAGTAWIDVRKATVSLHGVATGWSDSYGDGAATFPSISIRASDNNKTGGRVVIDGVTGSDTTGYGFVVTSDNDELHLISVPYYYFTPPSAHVYIRHCEVYNQSYVPDRGGDGIYFADGSGDYKVEHCYIHDISRNNILFTNQRDIVIDSCVLKRNKSTPAWHGQAIQVSAGGTNYIVKNCFFEDITGTAFYTIVSENDTSDSTFIYNNTFYATTGYEQTVSQAISSNDVSVGVSNFHVKNNTFVNLDLYLGTGTARVYLPGSVSNVEIENNLWYCDKDSCMPAVNMAKTGILLSNNWFSDSVEHSAFETNVHGDDSDPFVNKNIRDFRLAAGATAIDEGATLGSPYNIDQFGTSRPVGSAYDIGMHEYEAIAPTNEASIFIRRR